MLIRISISVLAVISVNFSCVLILSFIFHFISQFQFHFLVSLLLAVSVAKSCFVSQLRMSRSNKYHCVYEYLMMNMMYLLLQYAVVCTTPYYWNQSLPHPASVWVQLLCPSDNMAGEPKPFQFIPNAPGMDSFCTLIVEGCSLFQRYADT